MATLTSTGPSGDKCDVERRGGDECGCGLKYTGTKFVALKSSSCHRMAANNEGAGGVLRRIATNNATGVKPHIGGTSVCGGELDLVFMTVHFGGRLHTMGRPSF